MRRSHARGLGVAAVVWCVGETKGRLKNVFQTASTNWATIPAHKTHAKT
ncbi:hypothetical protein HMPREF9123_0445 [Neisseria bacilliformis ATCC BAA-1200]|uniref:Uncharacterized protein n=1 Tax=Neisseria bacilliformis ATCC BAA-1200 TaxID=888742 RepID=F2B9M2_9NEIS|nr:hypothetical protein HMPREF9123_0445 [Neisseria bacilliformis ATCC BAA-1200]